MIKNEDSMLLRKTQNGDKQAFGILVERYMQRAYFTALGFVGSHEAALDLSQEAFIRAYRAIGKFDSEKNFFTWYYRILKNLSLNFIRDAKHRAVSFSELGENNVNQFSESDPGPDEQSEQNEMREAVWKALNQLKPDDKEIILLKDFQDFSYKEIAEALDLPIGTVMSRLYYARKNLKQKLNRVFP